MKFKAIIKKKIEVPELGVIVPGQEFDVHNEKLLPLFKQESIFEEVVEKVVEEVVKKQEDGE